MSTLRRLVAGAAAASVTALSLLAPSFAAGAASPGRSASSTASGATASGSTASGATISGATISALTSTDPPSLDPARGFDSLSWSFIHATFVSLLTFDNSIKIVPWGAAALPVISDGGLVYTFHLRSGLHFTDGEPVTAAAYADGIERILNPATKSQLMAFYQIIKGAAAYSSGKASSVSGIKVSGAGTISFTLTEPDRTFEDIMALPNASAVPPKVVAAHSSTFGLAPVGDGPYRIESYVPGRSIVMVKNPSYFDERAISTREIDVTIGLNPETEALRVESGQSDVMMDNIPTSAYLGLHGNPRFSSYLHHFISIEDNYVALDMKQAPFTSKLVREAAAYAVNDQLVLRSISDMGTPLTQILAPGMPGFDPSVKPLAYDPSKARALLAASGHPGGKGLPTLTFAIATGGFTAGANVGQVVQQDLEQVGFKVQLKVMAPGAFLSSIGKYPLTMGIYGLDYPDPYDLIASQFQCSEIAAGNNWQYYCNPSVDATLAKSLALPLDKAIPVYRRLQQQILSSFPWIPLYYQELWYLVSPSVHGFGADPLWPMVFADWSK